MKKILLVLIAFLMVSATLVAQPCTYTWGPQTSGTAANIFSVKAVSNLVAWVCAAGAVIRKTTDGGATWTDGNSTPGVITGDVYNIEALDATTAWCTTSPGATFIYKTTNGGTTWTQVFTQASPSFINAIKMVSAVNGYAFGDVVAGNWVILTTANGGTTWTPLATAPAGAGDGRNNSAQVSLPNIWFGTGQGTIVRSTNAGLTWSAVTTAPLTTQVTGIKFNSATLGLGGGASMVRTTDGGTTYSAVTAPGAGTITGIDGAGNDFWYVRGAFVYRSTDAGLTFAQVHTPVGTQADIKFANDPNGCLVGWSVASAGNIAKMVGVPPPPVVCNYTWGPQTSGTAANIFSVKAVSNLVAWVCAAGAVIRKTTNGGATWVDGNTTPGVITGDVYNIEAIDANTAWCTTSPGATFIYKTTNGGTTWTQVFTQASPSFINAIKMVSAVNGYAFGDVVAGNWVILTTVDGGSSWQPLATAPAGAGDGRNNSAQVSLPNIWFGTGQGTIVRSTNAGLTWSAVTTAPLTTQVTGIKFNSATLGLGGGASMVRTTDGGTTYSAVTAPGAGTITGIDGAGNDFWYVRGAFVYRSTDAGLTFAQVHTPVGTQADIKFANDPNGCLVGWSVASAGNIAKMIGVPVGIENPNNLIPSAYALEQNYPNPFNPTTNIKFSIPKAGMIKLVVFDVLGREAATLVNEYKGIGNYVVDFDASALSSGVYFYRIESDDFIETKKMLLVK